MWSLPPLCLAGGSSRCWRSRHRHGHGAYVVLQRDAAGAGRYWHKNRSSGCCLHHFCLLPAQGMRAAGRWRGPKTSSCLGTSLQDRVAVSPVLFTKKVEAGQGSPSCSGYKHGLPPRKDFSFPLPLQRERQQIITLLFPLALLHSVLWLLGRSSGSEHTTAAYSCPGWRNSIF